jgi:hypothetical protein
MATVACLFTLAILLPISRLRICAEHDGVVLKPAIDVFEGRSLYRDSFSQYGPLTTYLHVVFLHVFGPKLLALRIGTAFVYGITAGILVLTWRRFLPTPLVILGFSLWLGFVQYVSPDFFLPLLPWSSVYALGFQVLALYAVVRATTSRRPAKFAAVAGAATALSFWCRFPVGTVLLASVVACLGLHLNRRYPREQKWSIVLWFLISTGLAHGVFIFYLYATGSLNGWLEQHILWPTRWASLVDQHMTKDEVLGNPVVVKLTKVIADLFNTNYFNISLSSRLGRLFPWEVDAHKPILVGQVLVALAAVVALARSPRRVARASDCPMTLRDVPILILGICAAAVVWLFFDSPRRTPTVSWAFLVPVGAFAATVVALWEFLFMNQGRDEGTGQEMSWILLVSGIVAMSSWLQYYPSSQPVHHSYASGPIIGVFAFAVFRLGRGRLRLVSTLLAIAIAPLGLERSYDLYRLGRASYWKVGSDSLLSGILVPIERAENWEFFLNAVRNHEREHGKTAILNETFAGLFAVLGSDHAQPTPFFVNWPGLPLPRDFEERRDRFIREKAPLIVTQSENVEFKNEHGLSTSSAIKKYGYHVIGVFDSTLIGREILTFPDSPGQPWKHVYFYLLAPNSPPRVGEANGGPQGRRRRLWSALTSQIRLTAPP